jgi:hypothetical protein
MTDLVINESPPQNVVVTTAGKNITVVQPPVNAEAISTNTVDEIVIAIPGTQGATGSPGAAGSTPTLAPVATSGLYSDLTGKPTIPDITPLVTGPASSTDNTLVRFDLATGKLIQGSSVVLDDSGRFASLNTVGSVTLSGTAGAVSITTQNAATNIVFQSKINGDTQYRYQQDASGLIQWGPGVTTAPDTNLYRGGPDLLKTDDSLTVAGGTFTLGADVVFSRANTNYLSLQSRVGISRAASTDLAFSGGVFGDSFTRWTFESGGKINWGDGTAAPDTTLYRSAVNQLATDGSLLAQQFGMFQTISATNTVVIGRTAVGTNGPGIYFGSLGDTNIYRSAADTLKTDDTLVAATLQSTGQVQAGGSTSLFSARFVSAATNNVFITKAAADTNDRFVFDASGLHSWGTGAAATDTNLYRSAVGVLKTDGSFTTAGTITLSGGVITMTGTTSNILMRNQSGSGNQTFGTRTAADTVDRFAIDTAGKLLWSTGAAVADLNLYRSAVGVLKTDQQLAVGGLVTMSSGITYKYNLVTTTLTLTTAYHYVNLTAAAAYTVTLPTAVGNAGLEYRLRKSDSTAFAVTIACNGAQTINGVATYVLTNQYQVVTLVSDGANWMVS